MAPNWFNCDIIIAEQWTIVSFSNAYCDITIPIVRMLNKEILQEMNGLPAWKDTKNYLMSTKVN